MRLFKNFRGDKRLNDISEKLKILNHQYNRLQQEYNEIWHTQTIVEFILDDIETGYVWIEMIKDYDKLIIGSHVVLLGENNSENTYIIERFDEWDKKNRRISFYINRLQDVPTT